MTLDIVPLQSDGHWPEDRMDLRAVESEDAGRLSVMMLGAGLSKAANAKSPTWGELVADVAQRMKIPISGGDVRVDAMALSWRGSRRPSTALETDFQRAVRDSLKGFHTGVTDADLMNAVAQLLTRVRCDVIIDLNYDNTAESMLDGNGIPYYRIVGAQMDVHPPLPEDMVVLWKIHGSLDYPATIVLSPTEYQRKYEFNDLGMELIQIGAQAHTVWTVGVGLQDDDVWTFLTANAKGLEIVALHLDSSAINDRAALLQPWTQVLGHGVSKVTVLAATLSDQPHGTLRYCVEQINKSVNARSNGRAANESIATIVRAFDTRFLNARAHGFEPSTRAIVEEFLDEHNKLVHFLLTRSHDKGHRWLPFFKDGNVEIDDALRSQVAEELLAILRGTHVFFKKFASGWPNSGLLIGACAQSIVRYVFEWLEAFDIPYRLTLDPVGTNPAVQRGHAILVGANPFDTDVFGAARDTFNPMHVFMRAQRLSLRYPLVARQSAGSAAPRPAVKDGPLLTEDEWEAAVISLFLERNPRLELDGREPFLLDWTWPVFPWGFGRKSIGSFRAISGGTVTQSWHVVSDRLRDGRQICKGGSLRDRGETVFMVARRGSIRIGEYDDFVQSTA